MRVRGEAPGGQAASLMSRQRRRSVLRSNPCRAERLRSVWKGAGDRDAGWRTDSAGDMRRAAKAMHTGTCVHAWRPARVVSDLQDVKKSRGYGGTGVRGYGGTGVRGYGGTIGCTGCFHCQPATALTVVMALHRHLFNPRTPHHCTFAQRCQTPAPAGGSGDIRPRPGSGILQARCTMRTTSGSSPSRA